MTSTHTAPVVSVVAPVYDEEILLPEFYRRTIAALEQLQVPFELILVNDGSHDSSGTIMDRLHEADPRVKVIHFSRNFGHQIAITAGTDHATGQSVAVIDSDLQDPPEVIIDMFRKWQEGFQVIYGVRAQREGETAFKRFTASMFYRLIRRITNINLPLDTGDFRLMDQRVVAAMSKMREHHRFMRGLSVWVGFKQTGVKYNRDARSAGVTKYPFRKMIRFALDAITSFSYLPLQLATYTGFAIAGVSAIAMILAIVLRLANSDIFYGQATTLVSVLFLGGIQLIFLGVIGEYLGRIYDEVKRRPLYIVAERRGVEEPNIE
jgi:glycosyltransferase involved in cell wall biosynthesis